MGGVGGVLPIGFPQLSPNQPIFSLFDFIPIRVDKLKSLVIS